MKKGFKNVQILSKYGNSPYYSCKVTSYDCEVDHDDRNPWRVDVIPYSAEAELSNVKSGCSSTISVQGIIIPGYSWVSHRKAKNVSSTISVSKWTARSNLYAADIRNVVGANHKPHEVLTVGSSIYYTYKGYVAGVLLSSHSTNVPINIKIIFPRVCGGSRSKWGANASRNTVYAYKNVTFTANYWGFEVGNVAHTVYFYVDGKLIGSQTNQSNGTISGRLYIGSVGNHNIRITCDGKDLYNQNWYFQEPPPAPPTMGGVNNTTWSSINTTQTKTLSASWWLEDRGWRIVQETYEWKCYSSHYGEIGSGTTTGSSASFNWNMPAKDVRDYITWKVRAKNNTGWSGWANSGAVEVYWAYIEPDKISPIRVTPNRYQLFDGSQNTVITFDAFSTIRGWGDRPGTRNVEYAIYKNGNVLKWNGRYNTSETGTFKQTLIYKVPETDLYSTYNVVAHKRLGNNEYTTSNDPRFPTMGANRCTAGNITFYEVIGRISGSITLNPSIIISGIKSEVNYSWVYDKQSSEKVDLFIEVYRVSTKQITDTFYLNRNESTSGTYHQKTNLILVRPQEADEYEIRLKATVTELLGNTHTYTLEVLTPEVYNPPVGEIALNNVSMPLPFNNASATLAKQATNITWDYNYRYAGVIPTKVIMTITSKPYNTELVELEFSDHISPYYNNYTRVSKGDFTLNSTVTAYMRIYYQIIGYPEIYNVVTDPVSIRITPTRYVYYLARENIGEQQLNKIHQIVNNKDETSKKIFVQEK